jgi:zinc/manganese transport system permease protein
MHAILRAIVEPGFFSSPAVQLAAALGGVVAVTAAAAGVFTVIRGQAFAGEALGDIGSAGGSSAYLIGIGPLWGFTGVALAASMLMELVGIQRARGRDLATGIVLGAGFGLAALLFYLGTLHQSSSGEVPTILFGSIFTIPSGDLPLVLGLGAVTALILATLYRPLLLASVSPELAAARGVPVRLVGAGYLAAMSVGVALAAFTIGSILSTALLVGPAAAALRLTGRPHRAILVAGAIGLACTWLGLLLSWDSYYWPPLHHGWPVSFFVVALVLLAYWVSGLGRAGGRRQR